MIGPEEARAHVLERVPLLAPTEVLLADAVGCVTAEAVTASDPIPSFDNTAMDGYALRAADVTEADEGAPARLGDQLVAWIVGGLQAPAAGT